MTETLARRAVTSHNVAAMLAAPENGSEVVSQAILGENVTIHNRYGDYAEIETPDAYRGWTLLRHLYELKENENYPSGNAAVINALLIPVYSEPHIAAERITTLVFNTMIQTDWTVRDGRYLPVFLPGRGACFVQDPPFPLNRDDAYGFMIHRRRDIAELLSLKVDVKGTLAFQALRFVGMPYLWGGRTPFGIDCSGFVQTVYASINVPMPRDAYLQADWPGFRDVNRGDIERGDLLFFLGDHDPRKRGITHVGMALGDGRFIHASGADGVAITSLNSRPYSDQLRCVRRLSQLDD